MALIQRPFRSTSDGSAILAVVHTQLQAHLHVVDLPYRLCSWAFDEPANCSVWEDANSNVLAWAVLQSPFWCIDYAIHPDAPSTTLQEVLAWADQRVQALQGTQFARPMWFVNSFKGNPDHDAIQAFGFISQANVGEDSWTKVLFRKDATHLPTRRPLPEGFQIRPLDGKSEVDAYVALHRAVFQSESMTSAWRERTLRHPAYQPELDLVLLDTEQQLAGFCIGWFAPQGQDKQPSGQIEPMGIRSDVRGRGFGKALLIECLYRLRSAGATSLFVETDNYRDAAFRHYQAVGFEVMRDVIVYRKDYPSIAR
jgi:mycothiol synthase